MMIPRRLEDGSILAPRRASDSREGVIGDGFVVLKPGDDEFDKYDTYMNGQAYAALLEAESAANQNKQ
jgi:hypothetical protein